MAGTITVSKRQDIYRDTGAGKERVGEKLTIDCTADATDGSFPATTVSDLNGYLVHAITLPGATQPTNLYDIALHDPDAGSGNLDVLGGSLSNRSATTDEIVAPVLTGATLPVFLNGDYSLVISNNSVNSASVQIILTVLDG